MRKPNLGGLFNHFIIWDVLLENSIDGEERLNLEIMKKRGRGRKKEYIEKSIYQ